MARETLSKKKKCKREDMEKELRSWDFSQISELIDYLLHNTSRLVRGISLSSDTHRPVYTQPTPFEALSIHCLFNSLLATFFQLEAALIAPRHRTELCHTRLICCDCIWSSGGKRDYKEYLAFSSSQEDTARRQPSARHKESCLEMTMLAS